MNNYNMNLDDKQLLKMGMLRCEKCNFVGLYDDYNFEPLLRKKDWIIGLVLMPVGGLGLGYLVTTSIERRFKRRGLQCPVCNHIIK